MKTLIKHELRQSRKQLLIWLGITLLLIGFCYFEFLALKDNLSQMDEVVGSFPRILILMFGVKDSLATALGWYSCIYFWTGFLAFAYAMSLGLGCVSREKKLGTAEYLFTKPVRRREIVLAKVAAATINLLVFAVFSGIGSFLMVILPMGGLERHGAATETVLGLFLTQATLFSVGLLITSLVKDYKRAVQVGTATVFLFFGIAIASEYLSLPILGLFSPLCYFDVYRVAQSGISLSGLLLAAAIMACCITVSVRCWNRREI